MATSRTANANTHARRRQPPRACKKINKKPPLRRRVCVVVIKTRQRQRAGVEVEPEPEPEPEAEVQGARGEDSDLRCDDENKENDEERRKHEVGNNEEDDGNSEEEDEENAEEEDGGDAIIVTTTPAAAARRARTTVSPTPGMDHDPRITSPTHMRTPQTPQTPRGRQSSPTLTPPPGVSTGWKKKRQPKKNRLGKTTGPGAAPLTEVQLARRRAKWMRTRERKRRRERTEGGGGKRVQ